MSSLRAVLLDVDGTLLDTNDLHAEAWVTALKAHGYQIPFARVRSLIGMGSDKLIPELTGLAQDDPHAHPLKTERSRIFFEKCIPRVHAFEGTRALLTRMREQGLQLIVASSASREELDALLERGEIADLLQKSTSSDDAEHSKPDPDIVHAALQRAAVAASEALMLGDTPYDVEACARAHVGIVALRCGGWTDETLRGALAIYNDPRDLLAHYDTSAFAATR